MSNITLRNDNDDNAFIIPEEAFSVVPEKRKNKDGNMVETGKIYLVAKQANKVSELSPENCPMIMFAGKPIGRASGLTTKIAVWTPEAFAQKADAKINQSKRRTKAEVIKMKDAAAVVDFVNGHTTVKGWKFSDLSDEHQKAIYDHAEKLSGEHPKVNKAEMLKKAMEAAQAVGDETLVRMLKDELGLYETRVARLVKAKEAKAAKKAS